MSIVGTSLNASCVDGRCKAQGVKPLGFFLVFALKRANGFVKKLKSHFDVPSEYASIRFQLFASPFISFERKDLNPRSSSFLNVEPKTLNFKFFKSQLLKLIFGFLLVA